MTSMTPNHQDFVNHISDGDAAKARNYDSVPIQFAILEGVLTIIDCKSANQGDRRSGTIRLRL